MYSCPCQVVVDKRSYEYKLSYAMVMCIWKKCEKVNLLERNGHSVTTLPTMRKVIKSCYSGWNQMPQIWNLWYKSAGEWYYKHSWIPIQIKLPLTILICLFLYLRSNSNLNMFLKTIFTVFIVLVVLEVNGLAKPAPKFGKNGRMKRSTEDGTHDLDSKKKIIISPFVFFYN